MGQAIHLKMLQDAFMNHPLNCNVQRSEGKLDRTTRAFGSHVVPSQGTCVVGIPWHILTWLECRYGTIILERIHITWHSFSNCVIFLVLFSWILPQSSIGCALCSIDP